MFVSIDCVFLGTCTDYDIPSEQLDIQAENGKEPKRLEISY